MADLRDLCTREGELSELTLFRYLGDELDSDERRLVDARLSESPTDRSRLDELRTFSDGVRLVPPATAAVEAAVDGGAQAEPGDVVEGPWSPASKVVAALVALAAVVVLAIVGTRALDRGAQSGREGPIASAETDGIRTKGSDFDLRVQVERDSTQWLDNGDVVAPGETVQFVAYPRVEGYVLVVGVDAADNLYPCHPNDGGRAVGLEPVAGDELLEGGLTFDDVLGAEHIIGLFCPEPFDYQDVVRVGSQEVLEGWVPDDDCKRTELRLVKESP